MIIPIIYPTASQIWLNSIVDGKPLSPENRERVSLPEMYQIPPSREFLPFLQTSFQVSSPFHLLAPNKKSRLHRKDILSSIRSDLIPKNSFIKLENHWGRNPLYIACPEYCFLNAAAHMDFLDLIQYGFLLCSQYMPDNHSKYHQRERDPISNVKQISSYLDLCEGASGVKKARQAIAYVLDKANSPMESKLAMSFVLPFSKGGFAIKRPELNKEVFLTAKAQAHFGHHCFHGDFVWEYDKVIAEYDSNLTHLEQLQHNLDKKRYTALSLSGYQVISITSEILKNFQTFNETCSALRWALGMRKYSTSMKTYEENRYQLFRYVLSH